MRKDQIKPFVGAVSTDANQSLQGQWRFPLCRAKLTPLGYSGSAVQLEMDPAVEMAFLVEMVVYRGVDSDEFLQGCVFFSQSLMQTLARSGSTKTGPFHGLHLNPVHEEDPPHYGAKAGNERTSLLPIG